MSKQISRQMPCSVCVIESVCYASPGLVPGGDGRKSPSCVLFRLKYATLRRQNVCNDEHLTIYLTPNTCLSMPKYTKAKVLCTQGKHTQLSSFPELCCCPIKSLAAANLPEYIC